MRPWAGFVGATGCESVCDTLTLAPGAGPPLAFSSQPEACPVWCANLLRGGGTDGAKVLELARPADSIADLRFFLVSDGRPDSAGEAFAVARQFQTEINTVFIWPEHDSLGRKFLHHLADMTGGRWAAVDKAAMLSEPRCAWPVAP